VKATQYFDYTRKRPDRARIKEDWIQAVIEKPEKVENNPMEGSESGREYQKWENT
jgi:hypothetical protein